MAFDLTGRRFGRLTVIKRMDNYRAESGYQYAMWLCQCDCGNTKVIKAKSLLSGVSNSCGCLAKELASERMIKHGGYGTSLYNIWNSMRQRCNNPNNNAYHNYGARGISICKEWDDFNAFRKWAYANGYDDNASKSEMTLDRIDVNKGYYPENCRWANIKQQSNNRRDTIRIEFDGQVHTLSEWAEITDKKYCTLYARYKRGWNPQRILQL